MLLALVLSFSQVANWLGELLNIPGEKIKDTARTVLAVCVAVYLINIGVAALSVPVVGVTLIVVGVAIMAYSLWPYFKNDKKKPDSK